MTVRRWAEEGAQVLWQVIAHAGPGDSQRHSGVRSSRKKSMRNTWFGEVVFCALVAATLGCRTPSPTWNGTWKLNPLRNSYKGPVITISISTDGEYHWGNGSSSFSFRCDGKYRAIGKNRTEACVKRRVAHIWRREALGAPRSHQRTWAIKMPAWLLV